MVGPSSGLVRVEIKKNATSNKASSRLYIIRICKYYDYSIGNLDLRFQSLILSVFTYA